MNNRSLHPSVAMPSRRHILRRAVTGLIACLLSMCALMGRDLPAAETRIKDITDVVGVRSNPLTGMGLVVGLAGTGSNSPTTRRFAQNMLQRFGLRADPEQRIRIETDTNQKTKNLSVVVVTAELPAFARQGSEIDVVVSSFDDATSLQGGTLIMTPLFGADGSVYAVGSGQISIGGFSFGGQAGTVQKNHPTVGRIPNGATVEQELPDTVGCRGKVQLQLKSPDFETARRIAEQIMIRSPAAARVIDAAVVEVDIPAHLQHDVPGFLGIVGGLTVTPDVRARVVINERTGTVIVGRDVRISGVLITHANLAVLTTESPQVSQPGAFSQGETVVVPRTQIDVVEQPGQVKVIPDSTSVGDLANVLNSLGVAPRDLSSIFQQLKESGSLHADLEFK